jgi:hypothetical protein
MLFVEGMAPRTGEKLPPGASGLWNPARQLCGVPAPGGDKSQAKALDARSTQILKERGRRNGVGAVIDVNSLRGK